MYPSQTWLEKVNVLFAQFHSLWSDNFIHGSILLFVGLIVSTAFGSKLNFLKIWLLSLGFGAAEEVRQVMVGRQFDWDDVGDLVTDGIFAAIGIAMVTLIRKYRRLPYDTRGWLKTRIELSLAFCVLWLVMTASVLIYTPKRCYVRISKKTNSLKMTVDGREIKSQTTAVRRYSGQLLTIITTDEEGESTTRVVKVKSDTTINVK